MKHVQIVAHFDKWSHANLNSGVFEDVADELADEWASKGWAIIIPVNVERAVIETPEAGTEESERETATVKRRGRPPTRAES